ncbi:MAG: hypothetical protein AMXMBFR53_44490 [Gemmatimonadota bacterium]
MSRPGGAGAVVFSVSRAGDLVSATATFDTLLARHGSLRVVTSPEAAPLLAGDDRLDGVEAVAATSALGWRTAVLGHVARARRAGRVVANLEVYQPRWRFVRRLARLAALPGYALDLPGWRAEEGSDGPVRHVAEFYAAALGLEEVPPPRLRPGPAARGAVDDALRDLGLPADAPVVVMHPGSHPGWTAKRADPAVFVAVARAAVHLGGVRVILVGSRAEEELCRDLAREAGVGDGVASLAGALGLGALPELIRRAHLFVGNDSAPLKVAEAVATRTVSLWTATSPSRLAPRGDGHRAFPGDARPAEVAEAALALLASSRGETHGA